MRIHCEHAIFIKKNPSAEQGYTGLVTDIEIMRNWLSFSPYTLVVFSGNHFFLQILFFLHIENAIPWDDMHPLQLCGEGRGVKNFGKVFAEEGWGSVIFILVEGGGDLCCWGSHISLIYFRCIRNTH